MSRLADKLMGMDRGASRPEGVGGIPRLTVTSSPGWRPAIVLVIVVIIVIISGTAILFRPRGVADTVTRASAPVVSRPAPPSVATDEHFVVLVGRGLEAAQAGNLLEAVGLLRKALEQKPTDADAWNSLGVVLVRQGEAARGVDAFGQALRFKPNHAEAHRNLAVVLDRQGMSREAVTHYRAFMSFGAEGDAGREDVRRRLTEISASSPSTGKSK